MKNGLVTPAFIHPVIPVLYLDLDIVIDDADDISKSVVGQGLAKYPQLQYLLITEHGPAGGNPVYRIEGPLPQLVKWLQDEYAGGDLDQVLYAIKDAKLAS